MGQVLRIHLRSTFHRLPFFGLSKPRSKNCYSKVLIHRLGILRSNRSHTAVVLIKHAIRETVVRTYLRICVRVELLVRIVLCTHCHETDWRCVLKFKTLTLTDRSEIVNLKASAVQIVCSLLRYCPSHLQLITSI